MYEEIFKDNNTINFVIGNYVSMLHVSSAVNMNTLAGDKVT